MTNEQRLIEILISLKQEGEETAPPNKLGITPSQVNIIDELAASGKLTVKDLSLKLGLTAPSISVGIKKLEKRELIKRESDEKDGRVVLLTLSIKGKKLYSQIKRYRENRVKILLGRLDKKEQNTMLTLLEKSLKEKSKNTLE